MGSAMFVVIEFSCGHTGLPPKLTPDQRTCVAALRFDTVTVGVERYQYPGFSDRLLVALAGTHLFSRVDVLDRFDTPPTFVARVDRPIYGTATMAPLLTAISVGFIPITVTDEYGYAFSLTPTVQPDAHVAIEFTYTDTLTLGWWGVFVNRIDGTLGDVYRHQQLHDALAWRMVTERDRLCAESYRDCRRAHSLRGWTHGPTQQVFP